VRSDRFPVGGRPVPAPANVTAPGPDLGTRPRSAIPLRLLRQAELPQVAGARKTTAVNTRSNAPRSPSEEEFRPVPEDEEG